jgi:DNA invertase Pin-like site-specific DNA recombinase
MGALAEFERDLIRERTKAGMQAAKKRGRHVGRPKALNAAQVTHMQELLAAGKTQGEVAILLGVSANTVGREVKRRIDSEP